MTPRGVDHKIQLRSTMDATCSVQMCHSVQFNMRFYQSSPQKMVSVNAVWRTSSEGEIRHSQREWSNDREEVFDAQRCYWIAELLRWSSRELKAHSRPRSGAAFHSFVRSCGCFVQPTYICRHLLRFAFGGEGTQSILYIVFDSCCTCWIHTSSANSCVRRPLP